MKLRLEGLLDVYNSRKKIISRLSVGITQRMTMKFPFSEEGYSQVKEGHYDELENKKGKCSQSRVGS